GLVPRAADHGARAADPRAGAQSHLAVLRRRRLAWRVDGPRAAGAGRPHRSRSAAGAVVADQPAAVSGSPGRTPDAARLRALRPDVPGRLVREPGPIVPRSRHPARGRRPAVRSLHDRQDAVQIRRWMDSDAVSEKSTRVRLKAAD